MSFSIGTTSPGGSARARKRCAEGDCRKKAAILSRFCGSHAKRCAVTSCERRTKTVNSECPWHVNARAEREHIMKEKVLAPLVAKQTQKFRDAVSHVKQILQSGGGGDFLETMSAHLGNDYRAIYTGMCEQVQRKAEQYVEVTDVLARQAAQKSTPPEIEKPESLVDGFKNLSI